MSFDGRVFLLDNEWDTYNRRMPVRYIRRKHTAVCYNCGLPSTADNPFQHAHLIPFNSGIKRFRLTPDFLDSPKNIVSAHRKICNKAVELSEDEILEFIGNLTSI